MADNEPASGLLTPGEVIDLLGIPQHSLKRWAKEHAAHMSPTAYTGTNQPGRFTQRDVEVLRAIKPLKARRLSVAQINERLSTISIGEIDSPADSEPTTALQTAPASPQQAETALAVVSAMQSALAPYVAAQQAQQAQIEDLARQRPTWRDVFIIGLGALMAGLMIGLSVWWFQ